MHWKSGKLSQPLPLIPTLWWSGIPRSFECIAPLVAQMVRNLSAVPETWVQSLRNIPWRRKGLLTTVWHHPYAGSKEELESLLMKEESEKIGLKFSMQKTKIIASGPFILWQIDGKTMETVTDFIFGGLQNHCRWWVQPGH